MILDGWLAFDVTVERMVGATSTGAAYSTATTERALVDDTRKLVRDASGAEVVSSTTIYLDAETAAVPPGSHVTLPADFGGRSSTVIAVARHDSGGVLPIGPFVELALQ